MPKKKRTTPRTDMWTVRLDRSISEFIIGVAHKEGRTRSDVLRRLIVKGIGGKTIEETIAKKTQRVQEPVDAELFG